MSRRLLSLAGCLLALAIVAPSASAAKNADLTIMSRNLYLGADIIKLVGAPDVATEAQQVNSLFETVQATNFPVRAKALAQEIARTKPDIIGLQEVTRYLRTAEGNVTGPATTVIYDWIALLQAELRKLKQPYRVAAEQTELDITTPSSAGYGLRLKLGNAVLVRTGKGARVSRVKPLSGEFTDQLQVSIPSGKVDLHRGYAGIDGVVAGKRFRFLDPHAEAYSAAAANGQFKELLAGPAKSRTLPTIIAGDFNSDPADPGDDNAYNTVIAAGFIDVAKRTATCCQNETVNNPTSELKTWIDHIVVRPRMKVLRTTVLGNRESDRIQGLWPSDHAGIVATIRLR